MPPVLEVSGLSVRFGGVQALRDLALEVNEWEIVGLIGPNGAGKTTAFNCIAGAQRPDRGTVRYRGRDVTRLPAHKRVALGIGRTFQNVGMVKTSTVLDNLKTAQHLKAEYAATAGLVGTTMVSIRERELTRRADALLELVGLTAIRDRVVSSLPYGQLKQLELGCALATDPDLLLLDEPSSGMGPDESEELADRLLALRAELGITLLVIEHHVPLVTRICDHVYVLDFGELLTDGTAAEVRAHPGVVAAYLGSTA
ncbi:MAG TPA: ABC transporter ATP-binding protein [Mycobacteriales bacterium]|nr:ABC transporter ATP-binding protein [Mycobacteriales bacterium]HVU60514.1 ABC transporter ATP-binding protein [Mycobacteriales bacterium]